MKSSTSIKGLAAIAAGILVIALLWTAAAELFFDKESAQINRPKLEESVILLIAENAQETIDFYTNVFDSQNIVVFLSNDNSESALINIDSVKFLIYSRKSFENEDTSILVDNIDSREYFIYSENIDSLYKSIEEKVRIISRPNFITQNLRSFSIEDVNGYVLTFLEKMQ